LLDTDIVAGWLNGRRATVELVTGLGRDLAISMMTYGEIYEGILHGRDPSRAERAFRLFLRSVDVLPLGRLVMREFGRIRGELRAAGLLIGDPDTLIAATATHHGRTLVTGNRRHFERVKGLALYPPR
jgi:predicted nucleic acid-binding protein